MEVCWASEPSSDAGTAFVRLVYEYRNMTRLRLTSLLAALLVLPGLLACSSTRPDPADPPGDRPSVILAVVGPDTLTADAFERRYVRSVGSAEEARDDSVGAYRDFLERYADFRLKVLAARDAGMDTLPSLQRDVASYRQQMARPTLLESEVTEPLVRTLYERKQEHVDVSHVLVRVDADAPPADTAAAYRKMRALVDSIDRGAARPGGTLEQSFAEVARTSSEDPSAQREGQRGYEGRLGYVTAGQLVKPFEDAMYGTPVGERSGIFRTRYGYHVLLVHDRAERPQPVRISHVMIRPGGRVAPDSAAAVRLADSLQTVAEGGAPFDSLAAEYSDDRRSAAQGGDLGFLQPGQNLPEAFLDAAFALDSAGAVSPVVETRFGYHVLKLADRRPERTFEEAYDDLKEEVGRMPRSAAQEDTLARQILRQYDAQLDTALVLSSVDEAIGLDSTAAPLAALAPTARAAERSAARSAARRSDASDDTTGADRIIATIGDTAFPLSDLGSFVSSNRDVRRSPVRSVLDAYMNARALQVAADRLEERDPEFAQMMQEYREGVLLFQYMQDSVWTVAAQDTAALRTLYRSNPERYRMPPRVRTIILSAPSDTLLTPYATALGPASPANVMARATGDSLVTLDTTFVQVTDDAGSSPGEDTPGLPATDAGSAMDDPAVDIRQVLSIDDGAAAGPYVSNGRAVLYVRDARLPSRSMTFAEAQSAVTRDLQDRYEREILDRLRNRYGVTLYPERLDSVFADRDER